MARDIKLGLLGPLGDQFYIRGKSKIHFLHCCLDGYDACTVGNGFCGLGVAKAVTYNITNEEVLASHQYRVLSGVENGTMNWKCCDSVPLHSWGHFSINSCIIPRGCTKGDAGIAVLPVNHLDAAVPAEPPQLLRASSTTNGSRKSVRAPISGSLTGREEIDEKLDSALYREIGAPVGGCILILMALYFFFCIRKRMQQNNEVTEILDMEMGNLGPRDDRNGESEISTAPIGTPSRQNSIASSVFTNPRPAPYPPPSSPPPSRPLPPLPLPRAEPEQPPLVPAGHRSNDELDAAPQWPLTDGINISASSGPEVFGLGYVRK
ncbi:hypothetical protein ANO14919_144930 [Xylariales sp. No.14919]|nr:hypothetical protein ANO14919_144930 [Xylariales sp. No.14919]